MRGPSNESLSFRDQLGLSQVVDFAADLLVDRWLPGQILQLSLASPSRESIGFCGVPCPASVLSVAPYLSPSCEIRGLEDWWRSKRT